MSSSNITYTGHYGTGTYSLGELTLHCPRTAPSTLRLEAKLLRSTTGSTESTRVIRPGVLSSRNGIKMV
ncbi:hypothetical protein IAT38_003392 [Cryptococcus sp. DSM 104549]